jgi:flagellar protein FliO/FliZ
MMANASAREKDFVVNRLSYCLTILFLLLLVPSVPLHAESLQDGEPVSIRRSTFTPVALKVPEQDRESGAAPVPLTTTSTTAPLLTVGSSLAIVLGLFAALVWGSRKASKNSTGNRELPDDALRILGKKSLGTSGSIALVRCGPSVLVIGIHSSGMQRLGEITGDEEVRNIEAICSGESKASFNVTLAEMQREPIKRGFIGEEIQPTPRARHKLFA